MTGPVAAAGMAAVLALGGCTFATPRAEPNDASEGRSPVASPSPLPPPPPSPSSSPTLPSPYEPSAGEVQPDAKRSAGQLAQALTTYRAGDVPADVALRAGLEPAAATEAAQVGAALFLPGAESTGEVVYAQLGGVMPDAASVMVVTLQRLRDPEGERTVTRALDVRLLRRDDAWVVDRLASAGGDAVPRPEGLPGLAVQVLDDPRITLPDSARWDIARGTVDQRVLEALVDMAAIAPIGVTVISGGHPVEVFGTARTSNHTRGAAVDVYAVGGRPVIEQRSEGDPALEVARRILAGGTVTELGSPWDLDGPGGVSFANELHADHLHVGFDGGA